MHFNLEELKYLKDVLSTTDSYTIARGEQIEHPVVSHEKLIRKIQHEIIRLTR